MQALEIAQQHGVAGVSPELCRFLSLGLEAHLGDLLRRAAVLARQRADVGRRLPGMEVRRFILKSSVLCFWSPRTITSLNYAFIMM